MVVVGLGMSSTETVVPFEVEALVAPEAAAVMVLVDDFAATPVHCWTQLLMVVYAEELRLRSSG